MKKEISGCGGGGGGYGGRGGGGRMRELGPPAFLTKTYNIVDDPNTNSIISWGKFGNSFIIWDHLQFTAEILPKYFKHSNLSSFVYQLNNYGFRKIGTDHQWEYENPDFQAGKLHLLANIKRRGQKLAENVTGRRSKRANFHSIIRPEILRNEMNESKQEIEKLKMEQSDLEFHIMALEEEVKNIEKKSKKLINCWAKACEIIVQKMREKQTEEAEISDDNDADDDQAKIKKRKLEISNINEKIDPNLDAENNQNREEMVREDNKIPSFEIHSVLSANDSEYQILDDHEAHVNNVNFEAILEKKSADYTFWKKILLDDDEAYEGEVEKEMAKKQARIALDLEDLIVKLDDE